MSHLHCCNPFDISGHYWSSRKKNLRAVTEGMCERAPHISVGMMICDTCRKKVSKLIPEEPLVPEIAPPCVEHSEPSDIDYVPEPWPVVAANKYLTEIGQTPFSKNKARAKNYARQKVKKITEALKSTVITSECLDDGTEMIQQLQEKFKITSKHNERLQILTVLPKSWTLKKIQEEFEVSKYVAQKSKKLVEEKGVLSLPGPKVGPLLSPETLKIVNDFYESDEISRLMPGRKDFVSVKKDGVRSHVQKRLVLSNLKEVYHEFKMKYCDKKIGFSKFASLRPKHCVLAGASGTHSVCVCTIHQNVKLMMFEIHIPDLSTYQHCLAQIMCNPPLPKCYFSDCDQCPGIAKLREHLCTQFDEDEVEKIIYKQWVSTDRPTLETYCATPEEFVESFCERLALLQPHSFIANEQAKFYVECKHSLQPGVILVTADFSENYAFILQDAAQSFHWNNSQATIHPFVAYYHDSGEVCHFSYVVVSDCLHHDTVAVYLFQKCFLQFVKSHLPERLQPKHIIYFSDGAASQYKNRKNFLNLCCHKTDFAISAEWHFSATSHGKGACDGLGGTVKRLAARASLQRTYNDQIMTPRQLYDWARDSIKTAYFGYCTNEDYKREEQFLEERFRQSRTIPGTRKLHSIIPTSQSKVNVRAYSAASHFSEERVTVSTREISPESIVGFVTCFCDRNWWLACVLEVKQDENIVKLTFLHPHGPSSSFRYPADEDVRVVQIDHILTCVDPRTRTGRTYTLLKKDMNIANKLCTNI